MEEIRWRSGNIWGMIFMGKASLDEGRCPALLWELHNEARDNKACVLQTVGPCEMRALAGEISDSNETEVQRSGVQGVERAR
jgi:hypothetical protein